MPKEIHGRLAPNQASVLWQVVRHTWTHCMIAPTGKQLAGPIKRSPRQARRYLARFRDWGYLLTDGRHFTVNQKAGHDKPKGGGGNQE